MSTLVECPVTAPVPVVRLENLPAPANLPDRVIAHTSSTVHLAPVGINKVVHRVSRWQRDEIGRKLAKRAQVQADSSYRIAKSWGGIDLNQVDIEDLDDAELARVLDLINLIKKAWAEYHRDQEFANAERARHTKKRRRRASLIGLASSSAAGLVCWQLSQHSPAVDAASLIGLTAAGSYGFGLVGKPRGRVGEREVLRPAVRPTPAAEPPVFEFPVEPHEDPLQLLRDIMSIRREGETAIWTSLLVRRLKEECGTRYSELYPKDLREMLKAFAVDPTGTPLEEGKARMTVDCHLLEHMSHYHPTIEAEIGDSKPLAGYHFDNQIQKAITLAESTNESEIYQ